MKKKLGQLSSTIRTSLLFLLILFMLSSCTVTYHWVIGQSRDAFLELNKKNVKRLDIISMTGENLIYKANIQPTIFFYFTNEVLTRVDRGERSPDIIIQNRH
jgi:hypothetical protein